MFRSGFGGLLSSLVEGDEEEATRRKLPPPEFAAQRSEMGKFHGKTLEDDVYVIECFTQHLTISVSDSCCGFGDLNDVVCIA